MGLMHSSFRETGTETLQAAAAATIADAAAATPFPDDLPDEIFCEILVRLPPESLLRCRAVCRAWRRVTSDRDFLLAHHARQPSLPIVLGYGCAYLNILKFDHRAAADAKLQPVARVAPNFCLEACCDGLLVLSGADMFGSLSVCNPATREHAPLRRVLGFRLMGMYLHRPTDAYRLLLHRGRRHTNFPGHMVPKREIGCYIFNLGSDHAPRRINDAKDARSGAPAALVRDSLHWYTTQSKLICVFDTIAESFRHIHPPIVPSPTTKSIFETEGTLGIYGYDDATKIVDIWVLQNYQDEVWKRKYQVKLPVEEIRGRFGGWDHHWHVTVVSVDGGEVLLLLKYGSWMFYLDTGGKLVDSFHHDNQEFYPSKHRFKQTLVPHTFFTAPPKDHVVNAHNFFMAPEDRVVNASPFI